MKVPSFMRDFTRDAELLGFHFSGFTGGGHVQYHNPDVDATYTTAATPSDRRGRMNAINEMERMSGRKLPRSNSGHYRHVRNKPTVLRLSDTERRCVEQVDDLMGQANRLRSDWGRLVANANRTAAQDARQVLEDYEFVRGRLAELHRIIPPITAEV